MVFTKAKSIFLHWPLLKPKSISKCSLYSNIVLFFFSEVESDLEELESKVEASGDEDSEASGTEAPLGEMPRFFYKKCYRIFVVLGNND